MHVVLGAPQPVQHHGVLHLHVVHTRAPAGVVDQIGGVGHALHAPCHNDLRVPGLDHLGPDGDGLEGGAAHLVDGDHGDGVGDSPLHRGLTPRYLPLAGRDDGTIDHLVHLAAFDPGPLQRLRDGQSPQVRGPQWFQPAPKLPKRRTSRAYNHNFIHTFLSDLAHRIRYRPSFRGGALGR